MKTHLILIYLIILTAIGCQKDDDEYSPTLPLITQTGENTFGCYVDGILVTPRNGASSVSGPAKGMIYSLIEISPDETLNKLKIQDHKSYHRGLVDIYLPNLVENNVGSHIIRESKCDTSIDFNNSFNIRALVRKKQGDPYTWYCSIDDSGEIKITRYDTINKILSGTFYCKAVNRDDSTDIIEITQGRFDIKWDILNLTYVDFP